MQSSFRAPCSGLTLALLTTLACHASPGPVPTEPAADAPVAEVETEAAGEPETGAGLRMRRTRPAGDERFKNHVAVSHVNSGTRVCNRTD